MKANEDNPSSVQRAESQATPELNAALSWLGEGERWSVRDDPSNLELLIHTKALGGEWVARVMLSRYRDERARLIAAAPELYAALKHALQTKHDIRTCNCVGCEDARAAFANVSTPAERQGVDE